MSKLELEIRRVQTGEVAVAEFESSAAAATWLRERPAFIEVRRVVTAIDSELESTLRAAMRPLDDAERQAILALEAKQIEQLQAKRAEAEAAMRGDREPGDPDRPMVVRWAKEKGMWLPDDSDDRVIPEHVRQAVLAWIDERNSWVRDRNQHVATAIVTVHPGKVGSESDRIEPGGQFVTSDGAPEVS